MTNPGRGRLTANETNPPACWSATSSIRAFQMMVDIGKPHARLLADANQRHRRRRSAAADEHARRRTSRNRVPAGHPFKTAKLFEASARGAVIADAGPIGGGERGTTACLITLAPRSSWSTTCSTTREHGRTDRARTSVTICAKALIAAADRSGGHGGQRASRSGTRSNTGGVGCRDAGGDRGKPAPGRGNAAQQRPGGAISATQLPEHLPAVEYREAS